MRSVTFSALLFIVAITLITGQVGGSRNEKPSSDKLRQEAQASLNAPVYVTIIQKHKQADFADPHEGPHKPPSNARQAKRFQSYGKGHSPIYYADKHSKASKHKSSQKIAKRSHFYDAEFEYYKGITDGYVPRAEHAYDKDIHLKIPYSEHRHHTSDYYAKSTPYGLKHELDSIHKPIKHSHVVSTYHTHTPIPKYTEKFKNIHHSNSYRHSLNKPVLSKAKPHSFSYGHLDEANDHVFPHKYHEKISQLEKAIQDVRAEFKKGSPSFKSTYPHSVPVKVEKEKTYQTTHVVKTPIQYTHRSPRPHVPATHIDYHETYIGPTVTPAKPGYYKYKSASRYQVRPELIYDVRPEIHREVITHYEEPLVPYHDNPSYYHKTRPVPIPPPLPPHISSTYKSHLPPHLRLKRTGNQKGLQKP